MFIVLKCVLWCVLLFVCWLVVVVVVLLFVVFVVVQVVIVNVVVVENFYGDVVLQIGGCYVVVISIFSNLDQDLYLFEVSLKMVCVFQYVQVVIYNGVDYDLWMGKLFGVLKQVKCVMIVVVDFVGKKVGDNLYLWYDLVMMLVVVCVIVVEFGCVDLVNKVEYEVNLQKFVVLLKFVDDQVVVLCVKFKGVFVMVIEFVFGYMLDVIGFDMCNQCFQFVMMNDIEVSVQDVVVFENDLCKKQVCVLIYNSQVEELMIKCMLKVVCDGGVLIVSVIEMQLVGKIFQ